MTLEESWELSGYSFQNLFTMEPNPGATFFKAEYWNSWEADSWESHLDMSPSGDTEKIQQNLDKVQYSDFPSD